MPNEALLYIITSPCGPYFPTGFKPISLYADPSYVRAFHGGIGDCKAGSNYGPTLYVNREAGKLLYYLAQAVCCHLFLVDFKRRKVANRSSGFTAKKI